MISQAGWGETWDAVIIADAQFAMTAGSWCPSCGPASCIHINQPKPPLWWQGYVELHKRMVLNPSSTGPIATHFVNFAGSIVCLINLIPWIKHMRLWFQGNCDWQNHRSYKTIDVQTQLIKSSKCHLWVQWDTRSNAGIIKPTGWCVHLRGMHCGDWDILQYTFPIATPQMDTFELHCHKWGIWLGARLWLGQCSIDSTTQHWFHNTALSWNPSVMH